MLLSGSVLNLTRLFWTLFLSFYINNSLSLFISASHPHSGLIPVIYCHQAVLQLLIYKVSIASSGAVHGNNLIP